MKKRNILFFFPDQWHCDWLGSNHELDLNTPNLDALMAEGMFFANAFTPSPLCAPARACLASGKSYGDCGVPNNHADYPLDQSTVYQRLRDQGYRTASVGKLDLHKDLSQPLDWGLDGSRLLEEWGFTEGVDNEGKMDGKSSFLDGLTPKGPYMNHLYLKDPALAEAYAREPQIEGVTKQDPYVSVVEEEDYCDNWLAAQGMAYLREFPIDQPWFLQVNFTGPHGPFDVTQDMHDRWEDADFPAPLDASEKDENWLGKRRHYAAMIENIDRLIGEFLGILHKRGEADNTLIVFASDHGEMLGEHGRYGKCSWHRGSASIPLIMAGPGITGNSFSDALVMLQDLTATFLDYSSAENLPGSCGMSLREVLQGESRSHRERAESELVTPEGIDWKMTFDGRFKEVTDRRRGQRLIYDTHNDPEERNPQVDSF